jgi:protein-tyrosine-phosphatase
MTKRVLFVCIKNASRSQMAEALVKMHPHAAIEVCSAGIEPGKDVHPRAIEAMRELGYDLSSHRPKHISVFAKGKFDLVAKMDTPDLHDMVHAKWMENWDIPDPAEGGIEEYRKVRDLLAERIGRLLQEHASPARHQAA